MQRRKFFSCALALSACGLATTMASGQALQMDINSLTATAPGWGGLSHTGTVTFSMDGNSNFSSILIDGTNQAAFNGVLMDFQGSIELDNGVVVGGSFQVELTNGEVYSCNIPGGVGDVDAAAGLNGPFTIDTLTNGGTLMSLVGGTNYGNVDVSLWEMNQPINGSSLTMKLGPGVGGTDDDVDIDLFLIAEPPDDMGCKEHEPNDFCEDKQTFVADECEYIQGMLEKREVPGPQPDTWLCVVDKEGDQIASNNDGSTDGNGKASGLWVGDGDGDGYSDLLVDNGDGTHSLRIIVTGFPDGFDGNCNGFFQNAPHGQIGEFTVCVYYKDAGGMEIRKDTRVEEFVTGAEAFLMNFTAPIGSAEVHIEIDNTTGREKVCLDRDFMCFTGLEPLVGYCITVVSGLDYDCNPTDTVLGWFDKNCDLIFHDDDSGPGGVGYSELCVVADINGVITIGITGQGDWDFDGLDDITYEPHGICGTYMLQVRRADGGPMSEPVDPCEALLTEAVANGDLNEDGVVNGMDLATMLNNWGMSLDSMP